MNRDPFASQDPEALGPLSPELQSILDDMARPRVPVSPVPVSTPGSSGWFEKHFKDILAKKDPK